MFTDPKLNEYFYWLVNNRQSDRAYKNTPVEKDKILRILEAARIAPSACNAQPWKFVVVDDPELKNRLADAAASRVLGINHFTKQAPVHIVIVMESANLNSNVGSLVKHKTFPLIDIGISAEHICLAAKSEGLGSCMLGWFDEPAVKKLLGIPKSKRIPLLITLGYPEKDEIREKKRKSYSDIVSFNRY
ncbi:MAG: nitroreductase family protein [Bacteroidales bacterium]|nr:nitroreductase family protein [Bacteroidales bacterium]HPD95135.1 nitroreductase family protein [Tenuifilaceae bacterium]HRX30715.1 nitroreductase family protein [Tenuifilaceae bacterium]